MRVATDSKERVWKLYPRRTHDDRITRIEKIEVVVRSIYHTWVVLNVNIEYYIGVSYNGMG